AGNDPECVIIAFRQVRGQKSGFSPEKTGAVKVAVAGAGESQNQLARFVEFITSRAQPGPGVGNLEESIIRVDELAPCRADYLRTMAGPKPHIAGIRDVRPRLADNSHFSKLAEARITGNDPIERTTTIGAQRHVVCDHRVQSAVLQQFQPHRASRIAGILPLDRVRPARPVLIAIGTAQNDRIGAMQDYGQGQEVRLSFYANADIHGMRAGSCYSRRGSHRYAKSSGYQRGERDFTSYAGIG